MKAQQIKLLTITPANVEKPARIPSLPIVNDLIIQNLNVFG